MNWTAKPLRAHSVLLGLEIGIASVMYRLVYVSSAVDPFTDQDLAHLLKKSRENNTAAGVTGILLYNDGNFMQCLEGPKEAVRSLESKIRVDPRHRGMIVLLEEEQSERDFSEWAMGFKKWGPDTAQEVPGYSEFLNLPLTSEQFLLNPSKAIRLLLTFKKLIR